MEYLLNNIEFFLIFLFYLWITSLIISIGIYIYSIQKIRHTLDKKGYKFNNKQQKKEVLKKLDRELDPPKIELVIIINVPVANILFALNFLEIDVDLYIFWIIFFFDEENFLK